MHLPCIWRLFPDILAEIVKQCYSRRTFAVNELLTSQAQAFSWSLLIVTREHWKWFGQSSSQIQRITLCLLLVAS